ASVWAGQAALDVSVTGVGPAWWNYGIYVDGKSTGNNLGIMSNVVTTADNTGSMHLAMVGYADGDAPGMRIGIEGNAKGSGANQSMGIRGINDMTLPTGAVSFGGKFENNASGTGATATAVHGQAYGTTDKNIGVYGTAANGTENWAGWFDGDVMVTGSLNATMASNNVNDPNGVTVISMNAVEDNGANPGLWAGEIYLNGPSTPNFQIGAPTWEGNNGPERARMTLFGTTPDGGGWYKGMMALSVDSDGTNEWGTLGINGANSTNFNFGAKSWEGSSDRAFMHMFGTHDAQGPIANFEVNQGGSPGIESAYINLQTQDGTNNYGIVQIGASGTNSESGGMWLRGANTGDKVSLRVDDDGAGAYWGQFDLMGPNSPNFTFGGKNWEGSADYPFMHMFGNHSGLGPAGIFELGQDGTGAEWGSITLQAQDGTNNYGTVNINTVHDTGGADPSGFSGSLSLDGNTSANVQLGSKSWENHNLGIISVHGATGSVVEIQANFDGINETGQIAVGKSTGAGRTWVDPHQLSMHGINDRPTVYLRGERFGSLSLLGEKDDGGTWVNSNIEMNVFEEGTKNVAAVQLFNTESGGLRNMTVGISSNFANQGVGAIELFDNIGTQAIIMEAGSGNVTANGSMFAVAFNTTSDARLKKNITTIDNSLSNVLKMRGVSYKWKDENMGTNNQIGLIAQEVEEV
ncbi:MAG: tail fiber domain-containing protein, partial [Cyclobacteriaceae bacterium]|nr:tail fiber domain-containing protein [Cyclobacteriaceae bacterium]